MAAPIVSTDTELTLVGVHEEFGKMVINMGDIAVLRFSVESSGVDDPYVTHLIDWGDGHVEESYSTLPVGREYQYSHTYKAVGAYSIIVRAKNAQGQLSMIDAYSVAAIQVLPIPDRQIRPSKWRGLALPVSSIGEGYRSVEDVIPVEEFALAAPMPEGTRRIVIRSNTDAINFLKDAQVTITQAEKFSTSGRVVRVDSNVIVLDVEAQDSYDAGQAKITVQKMQIRRQYDVFSVANQDWFFPITSDDDLIKSAVSMILSTRPGERVFNQNFGSRVHELPFEPNDSITQAQARAYVPDEISEQEPRAEVVSTTIESVQDSVNLKVMLRTASDPDGSFNVSVSLGQQSSI